MITSDHLAVKKQDNLPVSKKYRYVLMGALIGLSLFFLFRSCNSGTLNEPDYRIGQDRSWIDLNITGKERNLSAFNSDLLTAIAKQKHFRIQFLEVYNPLKDLENGKLDGILTTLQPSYLYENRLLFSNPYFISGPVLIIPSNGFPHGTEDHRKIIAISHHSPMLINIEQDPTIQIKIYEDIIPALEDLRGKRIDGAIFPAMQAYIYTNAFYRNEFQIVSLPLTNEGLRLITVKNPDGEFLIQEFNEGLEKLKTDGTYEELLKRWGFVNLEQIIKQAPS